MADLTVKSRNLAVAEGWIYDGNKGAGVFSGAGAASSTGLSVSFTSTVKSIPGGMFMTASFDTVPSNYLSDMNLDAYGHNGHDYAHVTSVSIASSVQTINEHAFMSCRDLKTVKIGSGVINIKAYAFADCSSLTTATMNTSLMDIGDHAFSGCNHLTTLNWSTALEHIGYRSFENCAAMKTLTLPEGLDSVGVQAFAKCDSLASVTLPASLTYLGGEAFYGDHKIATLTVKSKNLTVPDVWIYDGSKGAGVFSGVGSGAVGGLKVTFTSGVTQIPAFFFDTASTSEYGHNGYDYCYVTSVTIPSSVKSIGSCAFRGCRNLKTVTVEAEKPEMGDLVFDQCSASGFTVKCYYAGTVDTYCQTNGIKTAYLTPTQPAISALEVAADSVKVSWSRSKGVKGYYVYRSVNDGAYEKVKTTTLRSYVDEDVVSGGKYRYKIYGYCKDGTTTLKSAASGYKTTYYLSKPATPTASNLSTGVKVSWSKVTGATGYYVYRKIGDGDYKKVKTTTSTSWTDTGAVTSGKKYTYKIYAIYETSGGTVYKSVASSARVYYYLSKPATPTTSNLSTGVKVSWSKVTGATGYYVYRKIGDDAWKKVKTTASTSWTDTGAKTNGKKYAYKLYATYTSSSGTVYQSPVSTSRTIYYLTRPEISSLTSTTAGSLKVAYNKNSTATGYEIVYSTSSSFTTSTKVKVTSASTVSKTISSLTKGKKYYVKVRSYKTVSDKTYYSAYSGYRSVTVKS